MGMMYILAAIIDWDRDSLDRLISTKANIFMIFEKKISMNLFRFTLYYIYFLKLFRCILLFAFLVLLRVVSWSTHVATMYSIGFCQIV